MPRSIEIHCKNCHKFVARGNPEEFGDDDHFCSGKCKREFKATGGHKKHKHSDGLHLHKPTFEDWESKD